MVIPTLAGYETLTRVLQGFASQTVDGDVFDVLVVADAAEPDMDRVDRALGTSGIRHCRRLVGAAPGASANRNAGMDEARGAILLFTDNDTVPGGTLVEEHLAWHRRHAPAEIGVQGRVRWSPELRITTFMRWLDRGIQFDLQGIDGPEAGWGRFVTANVSLKTDFARRVGHFDQEHFPYGYEDTDWAYRASKLGFRLLYNPHAVVDHLREMTLEFWQARARRVAYSERTFHSLHPETEPWFHRIFEEAASAPAAKGRGITLAPYVPEWVPWLGKRVWRSVDQAYKQALAPHFLAAWEEWTGDYSGRLDLSEFAEGKPGGSSPGGPK